jgi:hypothetical protein
MSSRGRKSIGMFVDKTKGGNPWLVRSAVYWLRADALEGSWQSWNLSRQGALDALTAAGY